MRQFGQDSLEAVGRGVVFHHAEFRNDSIDNAIGSGCEVGQGGIRLGEDISLFNLFVTYAKHRIHASHQHPLLSVLVLEGLRIVLQFGRILQLASQNAVILQQNLAGRMSRRIDLTRSVDEKVVGVLTKGAAILPRDICGEGIGGIVEHLHARVRGNIEVSVAILDQRGDEVVCQGMVVGGDVGEGDEAGAIVAHQAVLGGNPHKSVVVLEEVVDHRTGQLVVRRQEPVRLCLTRKTGQNQGNQRKK